MQLCNGLMLIHTRYPVTKTHADASQHHHTSMLLDWIGFLDVTHVPLKFYRHNCSFEAGEIESVSEIVSFLGLKLQAYLL